MFDNHQLIENIRALCKEKGITVRQLELALGMNSGSISRFQKYTPSISKVAEVAEFLEVSIDSLLYGDNKTEKTAGAEQFVYNQSNMFSDDNTVDSSVKVSKHREIVSKLLEITKKNCYSWQRYSYKNDTYGLLQSLYHPKIYKEFDSYRINLKRGSYLIIAQYNEYINSVDSDIKLYAIIDDNQFKIKVSDNTLLEPLFILLNHEFNEQRINEKTEELDEELFNL